MSIPDKSANASESAEPAAAPQPSLNQQVAEKLRQVAALLAQQGANPFRVGAYRRAVDTVAAPSGFTSTGAASVDRAIRNCAVVRAG